MIRTVDQLNDSSPRIWTDCLPPLLRSHFLLLCLLLWTHRPTFTVAAFIPVESFMSWKAPGPQPRYFHPRWADPSIADHIRLRPSQRISSPLLYFSTNSTPTLPKKKNPWYLKVLQPKKSLKLIFYLSFLVEISFALWATRHFMWSTPVRLWFVSILQYFRRIRYSTRYLRRTLVVGILFTVLFDHFLTRRRQRIDPTSEWQRYAQYPLIRGWALSKFLLLQVLPAQFYIRYFARQKDKRQEEAGHAFSQGLLQLGPLYIKIGQILSCRTQLLPKQWQPAMERLQDQVPAQTGPQAEALAHAAWPGGAAHFQATFTHVDWNPLAAASLGQVHSAVLQSTGDKVALKLQRPYLRTIYDNDFRLLTKMAQLVDRFFAKTAGSVGGVTQSWTNIFADAEEILYREIDYRAEAENAIRFSRDFGLGYGGAPADETRAVALDGQPLSSAASWLRAPYVYDALTTEQVLVMEYVPSIKITATHKLIQANVTEADKEYLADCLGRSYLRQFCSNKFFSTDPHAGNLGVEILNMNSTVPEERVRLVYYDFGQAAELQQNQAEGILEIIEAIVDMDVDKSITSFQKMGVLKDDADLHAVRRKVADNYQTGKVKANRKKLRNKNYRFKEGEVSAVVVNATAVSSGNTSTADVQVTQYFTLPAEYAFVGRAISQMDGVGKTLDAEFDFVSSAAPWIYEIKGATRYLQEEAIKWITNLRDELVQLFRGKDVK